MTAHERNIRSWKLKLRKLKERRMKAMRKMERSAKREEEKLKKEEGRLRTQEKRFRDRLKEESVKTFQLLNRHELRISKMEKLLIRIIKKNKLRN